MRRPHRASLCSLPTQAKVGQVWTQSRHSACEMTPQTRQREVASPFCTGERQTGQLLEPAVVTTPPGLPALALPAAIGVGLPSETWSLGLEPSRHDLQRDHGLKRSIGDRQIEHVACVTVYPQRRPTDQHEIDANRRCVDNQPSHFSPRTPGVLHHMVAIVPSPPNIPPVRGDRERCVLWRP